MGDMLRPYLKIWDWDLIFGRAVKAFSSPGVRSPWVMLLLFSPSVTCGFYRKNNGILLP